MSTWWQKIFFAFVTQQTPPYLWESLAQMTHGTTWWSHDILYPNVKGQLHWDIEIVWQTKCCGHYSTPWLRNSTSLVHRGRQCGHSSFPLWPFLPYFGKHLKKKTDAATSLLVVCDFSHRHLSCVHWGDTATEMLGWFPLLVCLESGFTQDTPETRKMNFLSSVVYSWISEELYFLVGLWTIYFWWISELQWPQSAKIHQDKI